MGFEQIHWKYQTALTPLFIEGAGKDSFNEPAIAEGMNELNHKARLVYIVECRGGAK